MADENVDKVEDKKEAPAPKLDSSKPLTGQVDKLLSQLPEDDKKDDKAADKEGDKKNDQAGDDAAKAADPKDDAHGDGAKDADDKPADKSDAGDKLPHADEDIEPVELPPVAKYILENLPNIQVVGHVGEGKNRVFNVKRAEELPEGFEFDSKRDELIFNSAIASQELNARELLSKYRQDEQQNQVKEFMNQQAIEVQEDIAALQSEGVLPEFKFKPTDPKFNTDPAVKTANEIYELFEKANKAYADSKRSYRISYKDAADKYFAMKARTEQRKDAKDDKASVGREERDKVAAKVGAPQGADANKTKPRLPAGATMRDINRLVNQGVI